MSEPVPSLLEQIDIDCRYMFWRKRDRRKHGAKARKEYIRQAEERQEAYKQENIKPRRLTAREIARNKAEKKRNEYKEKQHRKASGEVQEIVRDGDRRRDGEDHWPLSEYSSQDEGGAGYSIASRE